MECCICYDSDDLILYDHCMPVYVHQKCLDKCGNFDKCFICRNNIIENEDKIPLNTELPSIGISSSNISSISRRRRNRIVDTNNPRVDSRSCWPRFICDFFDHWF